MLLIRIVIALRFGVAINSVDVVTIDLTESVETSLVSLLAISLFDKVLLSFVKL